MRRWAAWALLGVACVAAAAGCGSSSSAPAGRLDALSASAVSLPSVHRPLTRRGLAREAQTPALVGDLRRWGYEAGVQRYFQGESRRLQLVDSRTLRFAHASGATAFVSFLRGHLNPYLGSFATVRPYESQGRSGFVATGQECQCHLASPAYLAAVSARGTVSWLEINGPGATRRVLAALLARAP